MLFLDQPTTARATKVLRINENGIGFASGTAGTFDSWVYYQAWTLDGNLSLGGVNNSYGHLKILDSSGNIIGEWDKDGLIIYDSTRSKYSINNVVNGFRAVDSTRKEEGIFDSSSIQFEDKNNDLLSTLEAGGLVVFASDDETSSQVYGTEVKVENNSHMTEMKPDGFYVDGQKIGGGGNGYTGTVDVETNLEVDFDNEEYSADVYTLTFQDGILISVD